MLPPEIENKRRVVVKDWFKLILWYIRLRKAAKSTTKQQGNNDKKDEKT